MDIGRIPSKDGGNRRNHIFMRFYDLLFGTVAIVLNYHVARFVATAMALYEIDRDADTLIILTNLPPLSSSSSSDAARSSTPAVPAKRSVHGTATHSGPQEPAG
ncbi:hypothetical protein VTK73DRAFT_1798 [Phialemonium thermophilum]|uniref:Uncharacterized protein n=1 Tax=Phialemonium thermophilum TaxID=223376 RepID=A0ABR3VT04_9PEZI